MMQFSGWRDMTHDALFIFIIKKRIWREVHPRNWKDRQSLNPGAQ